MVNVEKDIRTSKDDSEQCNSCGVWTQLIVRLEALADGLEIRKITLCPPCTQKMKVLLAANN